MNEIEIVTPIRSQRPNDVKEWVDYHLAIGFDKITILDNDSTFSIKELLSDYKNVEVREIKGYKDFTTGITDVYNLISVEKEKEENFVAFIDDDEFIYIKGNRKIRHFLSNNTQVLCLPWKNLSSREPLRYRTDTLINTFTYCSELPTKISVKSIVNFNKCKNVKWDTDGPHLPHINNIKREFRLLNNEIIKNGDGNIDIQSQVFYNNMPIYLYHYFYQSLDDWTFKIERRGGKLSHRHFYDFRPSYIVLDNSMVEKKRELGI